MECFGTSDFDNNNRLITLSVIIISGVDRIIMIRRQSNNQWSGGIAAHPTPSKKLRVQMSAGKVLASIFCDIYGTLIINYLQKG
jgi:hypothetical protein